MQDPDRQWLPGFQGIPVIYVACVGGIFCNLFGKALQLLKGSLEIVKPYIISTAHIAENGSRHTFQTILDKMETLAEQ